MSNHESAILEIDGVSKTFDRTPVLRDVNLEVPRGTIVALLGASGSGKTTLLQIIAGLQDPDAGTLRIDGKDMRAVPPFERSVNMMFQSYALFPHLTVLGNVEYGLKARGVKRAERQRRLAWALELTRLAEFGDRRPDQLSGGQRQRVALARCLVMQPAILLLDEPMAALDRGLRAQVQQELISIQRKVGTTFIVVTHDQEEAMAISDYIAVMDKGRIAQFDPPRILYENPRSRFVASFLGNINLFDGSVGGSESGRLRFATDDGLEIFIAPENCADPKSICTVGFRPERLLVSRIPIDCPNHWPGVIEQVSYSGTFSRATIRTPAGRLLDATLMNVGGAAGSELLAGDAVHVGLPPDGVVVMTQ
ncbi:MAG: ABC transporter ATP-binding protein [Steroidobacteraceae bacterium]